MASKIFHFKAMQAAIGDFKNLLNDETMADVVFVVGGEKIKGHRQLIASRCEVMKTLLYGSWSEGEEIKVGNEINPNMFRKLLEFVYGGSVQIDESNALPLMELAHKYSLLSLEEACASFLGKTLDIENVLPIYQISLTLSREDLSEVCLTFIRAHPSEVLGSKAFLDVGEDLATSIISDDELNMDEMDIFEAALRWGKHKATENSEDLEQVMSGLVQVIRFPLIGASKLINRVKTTGVVPIEIYVEALEFSASPRTVTSEGNRFKKRKGPKSVIHSTPPPQSQSTTTIPPVVPSSPVQQISIPQSKDTKVLEKEKEQRISKEREQVKEMEREKREKERESRTKEREARRKEKKEPDNEEYQENISPSKSFNGSSSKDISSAKVLSPVQSKKIIVANEDGAELKYQADFDDNGLFYFIGTTGKTSEWENPATSGKVLVTSNAAFDWGSASNLLARKNFNTWTASQPGVWVSFSLRSNVTFKPNKYCLKHGYVSDGANLRNWVLEASVDGSSWVVLTQHTNDKTLGGNYGTGSWDIPEPQAAFAHFRLRSTGRDGGNSDRIQ